jgi:uncharacterized membrane protein HdeD (DUF308 family)
MALTGIDPVEVFLGMMWIITGIIILVRSTRDKADSASQRHLQTASGVCCLFLGVLWFLWPLLWHSS